MQRWTGIVLALSEIGSEEMASRLVTYLHPVAGRPLLWHSVAALAALHPAPDRVVVLVGADVAPEAFADLPVPVEVVRVREFRADRSPDLLPLDPDARALIVDATAYVTEDALLALLAAPEGGWLADDHSERAAVCTAAPTAAELLSGDPSRLLHPAQGGAGEVAAAGSVRRVRDRVDLSEVVRAVRDRLVQRLMRAGATFVLPDSVLVDVDVRIGRDSIVYPGVVLEGQTTIGEETVVGPGCRVIDSWIGSGVELKGWNYVSHTSIRNRAILEPYVRRGFD